MSFASGSCLTHSRSIMPQLSATSGFSYLWEGGREGHVTTPTLFSLSLRSSLGSWDHSPSDEDKEDLALGAHILHGRRACPNLSPKNVVEDLGHVFLGLR